MKKGSTQSEPPTRSPPKPPVSQAHNCYSAPVVAPVYPSGTTTHQGQAPHVGPHPPHYYKVPRGTNGDGGGVAAGVKPTGRNVKESTGRPAGLIQALASAGRGRSKFPLMDRHRSKMLMDTAYLTPKEIISTDRHHIPSNGHEYVNNRSSAFIVDINDTKSFLPNGKPLLKIKSQISRRIENVYMNMPKASKRINIK